MTLLAARGCQESQIRVSDEQAQAIAREEVDFRPTRTQVRLVRQGVDGEPYWAVSLSVPAGAGEFERLAVVRVDARTGAVAEVNDDTTKEDQSRNAP